ncbi:MAG: HD domain-containing protein [Candidatus Margulisbacteria bacterium]|nr:HD domain-containing protein [Candidatus Margulisiibacteriota bacterium]
MPVLRKRTLLPPTTPSNAPIRHIINATSTIALHLSSRIGGLQEISILESPQDLTKKPHLINIRRYLFKQIALNSKPEHRDRILALCNQAAKDAKQSEATFDRDTFLSASGAALYYLRGRKRKYVPTPEELAQGIKRRDDVAHSIDVCEFASQFRHECSTTVLCADMLHDTVEDSPYTLKQMEAEFGPGVAFLVDGKTKISNPEIDAKTTLVHLKRRLEERAREPIREALITFINEMESHPDKAAEEINTQIKLILYWLVDPRVALIAAEDRACILSEKGLSQMIRTKKAQEALRIHFPLLYIMGSMRAARRISNLAFSILEPDKFQRLRETIDTTMQEYGPLLDQVSAAIEATGKNYNIETQKHPRTPFELRNVEINRELYTGVKSMAHPLHDVAMMQIIVPDRTACFEMLSQVHQLEINSKRVVPLNRYFRNYIDDPKLNGYQSLHTAVEAVDESGNAVTIRFQIRTPEMQKVAEQGIMAEAYKDGKYTRPPLAIIDSHFLFELLDPQLSNLEARFNLIDALSEATRVTVRVTGPSNPNTYDCILPPNLTPFEAAWHVGRGMHFNPDGTYFGPSPIANPHQPMGKKVATVTINTQEELYLGDHLARLQQNMPISLVAVRGLRRWLKAQDEETRKLYAEYALNEALQQYHLTLEDLYRHQTDLPASVPLDKIRDDLVGFGLHSAAAATEYIIEKIRENAEDEYVYYAFNIIIKNRRSWESELRTTPTVEIISPLRALFGEVEFDMEREIRNDTQTYEITLPIGSPIEVTMVENLQRELKEKFVDRVEIALFTEMPFTLDDEA